MEVLQRTANRGSISTDTSYNIDNSIKFEADNSEQLYRTPSSDGNMKTWTYSVWFKRTELEASQTLISALDTYMYFETDDTAWLNLRSASTNFFMATSRRFRDTSAWYHAVIVCDLTDGTAADRLKLYINGVRETAFSNNTYENADSNDDTGMNKATVHRIGQYSNYGSKFCGYMAEANLIDGSALAPTEFGEFDSDTGIWIPKEYTGSYGTNGFYLDFADASDLGDDESGNGNDWTEGAITAVDQSTDTPTNNFCTINPLFKYPSSQVISEGATKVARSSGSGLNKTFLGTIPVNGGKWYAEFEPIESNSNYVPGVVDITDAGNVALDGNHIGNSTGIPKSIGYYSATGGVLAGSNAANGAWGATFTANDIIGVALDMDNRKVYFSKNGTFQNSSDPTNGTNAITLTNTTDPYLFGFTYDTSGNMYCNFGGYTLTSHSSAATDENGYGSFEYAPPSGYLALCTKNLAETGG